MLNDHIRFDDDKDTLYLLDQRYLPCREEWFPVTDLRTTIEALQEMVIRGAPAIGVTAAFGCYLCAREVQREHGENEGWEDKLRAKLAELKEARPTAVNLRWGVEEMEKFWAGRPGIGLPSLCTAWLDRAKNMQVEDEEINRRMGANGAALLEDGDKVMTHCNAGALATAGWGTAIGVVYSAVEQGKKISVVANETRPFLQGARLSAYELGKCGVDVTVACDNACALLMKKGLVDKVVVGADRIAANGDVANKIGTYGVALLAKEFGIPFYVAAPASTLDARTPTGDDIPIEERTPREVTHPTNESCIVPDNCKVYNFAFDVTPNELVTAIITDRGVLKPPYTESIARALKRTT
ncbi:S-methyl-5-thioribose-1-phosphate isomerase [Desulfohalovibrio reitneri]|uniref:S-methyl-5-thioribose-1-phosphate isomerase n=1 Tax=Desulfohalovibrio reitneri TaxID=1307759 RepID=UPI0004A71DA2|nr:S-methyl-5-thioribose-1-phosphate isomerase [Desulfohalovibrio reitneri]